MEIVAFIVLAFAAIASAVVVVTHRNPVVSVMALAVNLLAIAGFFFLMRAEFLALVQVIVYAGAILVLILFVVMLLNLPDESRGKPAGAIQRSVGTFLAVMFALLLVKTTVASPGRFLPPPADFGTVQSVGQALYGHYYYPFEVVSLLLIVAMVGAVLLAKRHV